MGEREAGMREAAEICEAFAAEMEDRKMGTPSIRSCRITAAAICAERIRAALAAPGGEGK